MKRDFIAGANERGRGKQSMNVLDGMKGVIVLDIVAIDRRQKEDANKGGSQLCWE